MTPCLVYSKQFWIFFEQRQWYCSSGKHRSLGGSTSWTIIWSSMLRWEFCTFGTVRSMTRFAPNIVNQVFSTWLCCWIRSKLRYTVGHCVCSILWMVHPNMVCRWLQCNWVCPQAVVWLTHIPLQEVAVTKLWETWEEEVGAEGCFENKERFWRTEKLCFSVC